MATTPSDLLLEDTVLCSACGDTVPRGTTLLRTESERICWSCHVAAYGDPDDDWEDVEEEEEEEEDDWDEWYDD